VGTTVAGDSKGLPGFTVGVPVLGALAVVVGVPTTGLTLGDPGVTVGVPVVGATAMGANVGHQWLKTQRGFQESLWVFLW
jgi:hypothetical protein